METDTPAKREVHKDNSVLNLHLKQCMARVAEHRDRDALNQLFEHFVPLIRAFSLAKEPGATLLADELAQDVIIKVWNKAHTYKPQLAQVSTWVFTLARNSRIDQLRQNGRYCTEIDPADIFVEIEDEYSDPFQTAYLRQVEIDVRTGLDALPVEQANVLRKVYLEGKSHVEASEELGMPLGTVKSRIRLALQKLEILLKR